MRTVIALALALAVGTAAAFSCIVYRQELRIRALEASRPAAVGAPLAEALVAPAAATPARQVPARPCAYRASNGVCLSSADTARADADARRADKLVAEIEYSLARPGAPR